MTDPAEQVWIDVAHEADRANEHLEHAKLFSALFSKRERAEAEHEADKAEVDMLFGLYWLLDNGRLFGEIEFSVKSEREIRSNAGFAMLSNGAIPGYDSDQLRVDLRKFRAEIVGFRRMTPDDEAMCFW